jgi:hypothetical protein
VHGEIGDAYDGMFRALNASIGLHKHGSDGMRGEAAREPGGGEKKRAIPDTVYSTPHAQ